jgi:shikimate dehydrogenase
MNAKNTTRHLAVIGRSLRHTLSPAMHSAVLKAKGLPYTYGVIDVASAYIPAVLASLRDEAFLGANVTIPHKEIVMELLDELSDESVAVGAVNTIVNKNGRLTGHNTDIIGIKEALLSFSKDIANSNVLILGAGGAAKAAGYAVAKFFSPRTITVHNRNRLKGAFLVEAYSKKFHDTNWMDSGGQNSLSRTAAESTLIINATPIGMYPHTDASPLGAEIQFSNHQIIFDIIYNPIETVLLRRARSAGARTVSGLEMFIHQGAKAFELWTGEQFPFEIARQTVLKELKGR